MQADLFDKSEEYDAQLRQGLRFTGESKQYFMRGRIRDLREQLGPHYQPRKILDFGCGVGDTAQELAEAFSGAHVVGVDSATNAIRHAQEHYRSARISFVELHAFRPTGDFDLCYCSGVFHHVPKDQRHQALELIWRALAPQGRFALFENNPWNPGTRVVMKSIPFDRDAETLSPIEALTLVRSAAWQTIKRPRFLFFFPRWLAFLRSIEARFAHVPLGGQYYVLATKKAGDHTWRGVAPQLKPGATLRY